MTEAGLRAAIVAEALSWEGTPYANHGNIKGLACDCAQLPLMVFSAVGIVPELRIRDYSSQWMNHRDEEIYVDEILKWAREIPVETVKPGDLVVWKFGRTYSHSAIVIFPPAAGPTERHVIHAAVRGSHVFRMNMDLDEDYKAGSKHPRRAFSAFTPSGQLYRPEA